MVIGGRIGGGDEVEKMDKINTIEYLLDKEWSMGTDQCPECCGVSSSWLGHFAHLDGSKIGHKENCKLAVALKDSGITPIMIGEFVSDTTYECHITDDGVFSTRPKTKDGCPKLKARNKKLEKESFL